MKKKFYDIIPQEKRSIRNIPLPASKNSSEHVQMIQEGAEEMLHADIKPKHAKSDHIQHSETHAAHSHIAHTSHEVGTTNIDGVRRAKRPVRASAVTSEESIVIEQEDRSVTAEINDSTDDSEETYDVWNTNRKNRGWKTWTGVAILAFGGLYALSVVFASADIRINPVKHEVAVNAARMYLSDVKYRVTEVSAEAHTIVQAQGTAKVERKATGRVVLYNAFNSADQLLVVNTRLETPEGLVFMTKTPVTIPGQKIVNGKAVPGSVEVDIEASELGDKYNVGFKDFKLVAYKGSDRYDKIYGRTKTSISNGYAGEVPNVSQNEITTAIQKVKTELLAKLKENVNKELNESKGEVFIPDAFVAEYTTPKQEVSKDGKTLTITQKVSAKALIFDKSSVSQYLIKTQNLDNAPATSSDMVYTGDLSKLSIAFPTDTKMTDLERTNVYLITSGTSSISSYIDTLQIAKAVSGLSREQAISAIKRLVELESIEVSIKPWWQSKIPSASKKVHVIIEK